MKLSVIDTGAVAGREALQTAAFQAAIDRVFLAGGGEVVVPRGVFHIGGIRLRSHVTLHLLAGAELHGSRDPEEYLAFLDDKLEPVAEDDKSDAIWQKRIKGVPRDYSFTKPAARWANALIRAIDAEDIAVIGEEGALIDGHDPYDEKGEERYRGPHGMTLFRCKNVTLSGYTVRHTGNWAHAIYHTEGITVRGLTVLGGHDGVHFMNCTDIDIADCEFYTGDDCIAGVANLCVHVTRCVLNTACSGFRFGGTDILIEHCRFFGPAEYLFRGSLTKEEKQQGAAPDAAHHRKNMLSAYTYYCDYSVPVTRAQGNIVLRDCTVENVDRFLHFNFSGNEQWQCNRAPTDITMERIKAVGITLPLTAYADPAVPFTLTLTDLDLTFADGKEDLPFLLTANSTVRVEHLRLSGKRRGALVKTWGEMGTVRFSGLQYKGDDCTLVEPATEPFKCKSI